MSRGTASIPRVLLLLLAATAACASSREQWAEVRFRDVSFTNLFRSVADVLESEGYPVRREDPVSGRLETEWLHGESLHEVRGPSRSRVFANIGPGEIEQGEDEPAIAVLVVRLRVAEEVIRKGGLGATNVRESEDWEEFRDNFERAEFLAEKVRTLLADQHVPAVVEVDAPPGRDG